jgi:hypothetical protein
VDEGNTRTSHDPAKLGEALRNIPR